MEQFPNNISLRELSRISIFSLTGELFITTWLSEIFSSSSPYPCSSSSSIPPVFRESLKITESFLTLSERFLLKKFFLEFHNWIRTQSLRIINKITQNIFICIKNYHSSIEILLVEFAFRPYRKASSVSLFYSAGHFQTSCFQKDLQALSLIKLYFIIILFWNILSDNFNEIGFQRSQLFQKNSGTVIVQKSITSEIFLWKKFYNFC